MTETFDPEAFRNRVREQLKLSREAFNGLYAVELGQLCGLSREQIDSVTPGDLDTQKYDELLMVVKEASRVNLAQAELKSQIEKLGNIAVSIAKKVPSLASIF